MKSKSSRKWRVHYLTRESYFLAETIALLICYITIEQFFTSGHITSPFLLKSFEKIKGRQSLGVGNMKKIFAVGIFTTLSVVQSASAAPVPKPTTECGKLADKIGRCLVKANYDFASCLSFSGSVSAGQNYCIKRIIRPLFAGDSVSVSSTQSLEYAVAECSATYSQETDPDQPLNLSFDRIRECAPLLSTCSSLELEFFFMCEASSGTVNEQQFFNDSTPPTNSRP